MVFVHEEFAEIYAERVDGSSMMRGTITTFKGDKLIGSLVLLHSIIKLSLNWIDLHKLQAPYCNICSIKTLIQLSRTNQDVLESHDAWWPTIRHSGFINAKARLLNLDKVVDKFIAIYPHCRIQPTFITVLGVGLNYDWDWPCKLISVIELIFIQYIFLHSEWIMVSACCWIVRVHFEQYYLKQHT